MSPERILQMWLQSILTLYASRPLMVEQIFQQEDQSGMSGANTTASYLEDLQQRWIPNSWVGGKLRYHGVDFPIISNTAHRITVTGNLLTLGPPPAPYVIVPYDVVNLEAYLALRTVPIEVSYSRLPTHTPILHLRLESDRQVQAYVGESAEYRVDPILAEEQTWVQTEMEATYLLTIVTQNPQETVWLYHLIINAYQGSQLYFTQSGLHGITMTGADVHPDITYLPESVYSRYVHISFTRIMQAVIFDPVEQITAIETIPDPRYQTLDSKGDPPMLGGLAYLWDALRWKNRKK